MTIGRPEALGLLAIAVPLVVLHLHLRRRRRVVVTSVDLWRDLAAGRAGRGSLRHVRDGLALAFLLAALASFAGAAADPVLGAPPSPSRRLAIVIDASATMSARAGAGSRFDAARAAAEGAIARLAPADEVAVWLATATPFVAVDPTRDHGAARAALARLRPTLQPRRLATAARLAARAAPGVSRRDADVLVLTDRSGAEALEGGGVPASVRVGVVDEGPCRNTAIAAFDVDPGDATRALVRIETTDGEPEEGRVALLRGDLVLAEEPFASGGATVALDLGAARRDGGLVEARIALAAGADDFAPDDAATLLLPPARPLAVALVAETPSPFLVEALRALPDDLVDPARTTLVRPGSAASAFEGADVVLADAAAPPDGKPALTFGHGGRVVDRPILWGAGAHPVLAGVDLAPLRIEHASLVQAQPGDATIVATAAGVVGVAGERGGARRVILGFRPDATTLPLEAAFPLLVRNALRWLGTSAQAPRFVVAGEPLPGGGEDVAPYPAPEGPFALRLPTRATTALRWAPGSQFRLAPPEAAAPATARDAIASLADRSGERDTRERLAPWLAAAGAASLAAGAALLRRPAPARATPPSIGTASARSSREEAMSLRA